MAKKRKKPKRGDASKKERVQEPQSLFGMKFAEAIAKKESEGFSEKKSTIRGSTTDSGRGKLPKEEGSVLEKPKDTPITSPPPPKSRHRVYTPDRKQSVVKPKIKPPKTSFKTRVESNKPVLPKAKAPTEGIKKKPAEAWEPVRTQGEIQLKTSRTPWPPENLCI